MSIRIRTINGLRVALCAARSMPKDGDVYLTDADHHALAQKFACDFNEEGHWPRYVEEDVEALANAEESNNPNRESWDKLFGDG